MDSKIRCKTAAFGCSKNKEQRPVYSKASTFNVFGVIFLCSMLFALSGCKSNEWVDWKTRNEMWLMNNKNQPGVKVSSTGLQYKIIADPTPDDARPNKNSTILCDYTLTLINGYVIENARDAQLSLSSTIPGFQEGCHKIHANGDIELYIPASLGYDFNAYQTGDMSKAEGSGTEGTSGYIPPHSTLIFKLHIGGVSGE